MYKGQATIEFLASIMLFMLVLISTLAVMSDKIPDFRQDIQQSSKNMEVYSMTERILTSPGYHTEGGGGTDWENNIDSIESFGLAQNYFVLNKDKIESISTTGDLSFNYTQFRQVNDLQHQYHFDFIRFPIIETSKSFSRTESPSKIIEPDDNRYQNSQNRVHYGSMRLEGENYRFLVTAHDGVYDNLRISQNDWDFSSEPIKQVGDTAVIGSTEFVVKELQNREEKPGTSVILEHEIKSFGANQRDVDQRITKFNRYAVLDAPNMDRHPIRIEVLAW